MKKLWGKKKRNMNENQVMHSLGEIESSLKSAHKRIDAMEKLTNSVYELAISLKAMQGEISDISERIKNVEDTPKKRWDLVCTTVISAVVGYFIKGLLM